MMYQNLPLMLPYTCCSYMCRVTLRNFVGNILTLLNFLRKIPTHDIMTRNNSYKCKSYSYICKNNSCTARRCLTLCAKCRNLSYKILVWEDFITHNIIMIIMIKVSGKGRACIPEGLIKAKMFISIELFQHTALSHHTAVQCYSSNIPSI